MKKSLSRGILAAIVVLAFSIHPAQADEESCDYANEPCKYEVGFEWIVGIDINTYTCFSLVSPQQRPVLQFQIGNKWVNKVKASVGENESLCSDPEYPYFVLFNFVLDTKGQISFGNEFKKRIKSRIYIPKMKSSKAYYGEVYTNNVYPSFKRYEDQIRSNVISQMNKDLEDAISSAQSGSSGNQGSFSNSKLSGCIYKNQQLFGKVQIVDYGADFKVQKVDYGSDLKVRTVDYGASSCGKWQFVDYGANFKIQFVDYGSDFKVQFVDYGEGVR